MEKNKIAGIDEAGRGPIIGPLIIVGVSISDQSKLELLKDIGVKDSKKLSKYKREQIYEELKNILDDISIKKILPNVIDYYVLNKSLNILELHKIAEIINDLRPKEVYIDAISRNYKKLEENLKQILESNYNYMPSKFIIENKADDKYIIVSAASIIAKVVRDNEIEKIKEKLNIDFGSGYPSDPKTIKALKKYEKELKPYIRTSWKTYKILKESKNQKTLDFFL